MSIKVIFTQVYQEMLYFPILLNLEFYFEMYLEFKKKKLRLNVSFEYKSSYITVILTGIKKNRKWVNGAETLHPSSTPPTLSFCVYSDSNYFIH